MKTKSRHLILTLALLALSTLNSQLSTAFAQGSLTPPGQPAPTMKTADQIYSKLDPRTIVNSANTPGNSGNLFIISQPGSYYLTTNLTVSSGTGIAIHANNVTLDLNGFALKGMSGSFYGITIQDPITNITVLNGTISGFLDAGIYDGSPSPKSRNLVFERLNVSDCGFGIEDASIVRNCNFENNSVAGIDTQIGCSVMECFFQKNGCGIQLSSASGCKVIGNTCVGNGVGIGMIAGACNNRVEDNQVTASSSAGISVDGDCFNNIIIKNSVSGNGANNYAGAGISSNENVVGPQITTTGTITSVNPWANFSF